MWPTILVLSVIPPMIYISLFNTALHTVDEITSNDGPIWEWLQKIFGGPIVLWTLGYITFQVVVASLPILVFTSGLSFYFCVGQRLFDVIFTHLLLPQFTGINRVYQTNPGKYTAPLLLIECFLWFLIY